MVPCYLQENFRSNAFTSLRFDFECTHLMLLAQQLLSADSPFFSSDAQDATMWC
uniref:Uncharacterized protein n=1 Tax=Rhizophora mucronata TaxID=61149 RepID=A0A2P2NE84_RHIMU